MLTYPDLFLNLLPPVLILISGYSLRVIVQGKAEGIIETWVESAVVGSALLIVPAVVIGPVLIGSLSAIFWADIAATVVLASLALRLRRKTFLSPLNRFCSLIRDVPNSSTLEVVALAGFASLLGKAVVVLSVGQLGVDAMASVLPNAVYFKDFNGFGPFADPPAVSLLYSWALSTVGLVSTDAFRLIPLISLIGIPSLIFLVARKHLGRTSALVAFALSSFAPLIDQSLLIWAHYADLAGLFFAFAGVWFLLKERSELLCGLSTALAILSKSVYGLAGVCLCIFIILGASPKRRTSLVSFVAMISVILAYGLVANASKISEIPLNGGSLAAALLMAAFATGSFVRAQPTLKNMPKIPLLLIPTTPAVFWILRQVIMGGSPLALPLIGGPGGNAAWWLHFQGEISGPAQLGWSILLSVFSYPSFDLYLTPFVIAGLWLSFRRSGNLLLLFATSYLLFFGSMGAFFSARYLAFFLFSLYPLAGAGLASLANDLKDHRDQALGIVTLGYAATSAIQQPRGYLSLQWLSSYAPSPLMEIARLVRLLGVSTFPWLDHPEGVNIDMLRLLAQGLILSSIVTMLVRSLSDRLRIALPKAASPVKPRMKFRKWTGTLLVFVIVSAMVLQGYYSAGGIAGAGRIAVANPLSFPVTGSWYREKLEVAMHLANQIPRGETVLTFSFGAYYYLATEGIYYVDLIDGALSSYPLRGLSFTSTLRQLLQSDNLAEIKNALTSIDATFILVPTAYNSTVPFEYSLFEKFNQNSDLLRILREAGLLSLLWEYGHYQLYELRYYMRPMSTSGLK